MAELDSELLLRGAFCMGDMGLKFYSFSSGSRNRIDESMSGSQAAEPAPIIRFPILNCNFAIALIQQ
jgi:hypothetical protein